MERPFATSEVSAPARRIVVIPREDDPSDTLGPPVAGRPRTGVRPTATRAPERPFERDEAPLLLDEPPAWDADLPVSVDTPGFSFWPVPARLRRNVRYGSTAWIVAGGRSIEGRCDGIGIDGVLLQVPSGQVLVEDISVCLTLPLSSALVPVACIVEARTRGIAGTDVLSCRFALLPRDVEREIELYVAALLTR